MHIKNLKRVLEDVYREMVGMRNKTSKLTPGFTFGLIKSYLESKTSMENEKTAWEIK